jgi:pimeloyl-ACP methyl ester carboxylesterase
MEAWADESSIPCLEDPSLAGVLPPSVLAALREVLWPFAIARLALRWRDLPTAPVGGGRPVLLLPGYGTGEASMSVLSLYLRRRGFRPHGWGLGLNDGNVRRLFPRVYARVDELARREGRPISLVGWSMGGFLAREVARDMPDWVERVVTIGSPVVGGPKYTRVARLFRLQGWDLDEVATEIAERYRVPLRVPVTAIYSKRDGIVAWQSCLDAWTPGVEHVEVDASHLGLGFSPEVLPIVADRLALGAEEAAAACPPEGDEPQAEAA